MIVMAAMTAMAIAEEGYIVRTQALTRSEISEGRKSCLVVEKGDNLNSKMVLEISCFTRD
jgi:hypothetical protein